MKKLFALLLLLLLVPCRAEAVQISATAAAVMDGETGQLLYEKSADRQMSIASTTKIMTALVVLEHCRLQDTVTVKPEHMAEGSSMYLKPGETVTVEALLYGLLLCSGNDAALVLADHCAGSVERFVTWMNDRARLLGMEDTSFANPNGLDAPDHYSTARDMAVLAACAAREPTLLRICSTVQASVGARTMQNHNRLLRALPGCIGMKTGYTSSAGRTLVTCVRRESRLLVAVTLQDGNDWADHTALYDECFSALFAPNDKTMPQGG